LHGRCPACAAAIQFPLTSSTEDEAIQAGPPPLPPAAQELEHSITTKPALAIRSEDWKTVRIGLTMILAGLAILATLLLISLFVGLMDHARPETRLKLGELVAYLWFIGMGASVLTIFLGLCVCCTTPTQARAREFVLLSVVCAVGVGICIAIYAVSLKASVDEAINRALENVAVRGHPGPVPEKLWSRTRITAVLGGLLAFGCHVLFVFYLRYLAQFFAEESLVRNTGVYLRVLLIVLALNVLIAFVPEANNRRLLFWLSQGVSFAGAIMLFWLMNLIQRTQETIATALKQQI
jgi:hypothetical protein